MSDTPYFGGNVSYASSIRPPRTKRDDLLDSVASTYGYEDISPEDQSGGLSIETQNHMRRRGITEDELAAIRRELGQNPQAFGAGRRSRQTATINGKTYQSETTTRPDYQQVEAWVKNQRIKDERDERRAKEAAVAKEKAYAIDAPVRAAQIAAEAGKARDEKDFSLREKELAARLEEAKQRRAREDEDRALRRTLETATVNAQARDIEEMGSAKTRRRNEAIERARAEARDQGLEFNQDEQRAALRRLAANNPDVGALSDSDIEAHLVRPSAQQAAERYAAQADKLKKFIAGNWLYVSDADKRKIVEDTKALVAMAQQDLAPAQLERFKRDLAASLGGVVEDSWLWDMSGGGPSASRRSAIKEALGLP